MWCLVTHAQSDRPKTAPALQLRTKKQVELCDSEAENVRTEVNLLERERVVALYQICV